ncbi:MAG: amidase family protein [Candidatus Binatia bacterium]
MVAARSGQETIGYGGVEESILMAMIRCTAPFNVTGLPALSLPCGFTRAGLPIGLQLVGRLFDESTVLRAGGLRAGDRVARASRAALDLVPPSRASSGSTPCDHRSSGVVLDEIPRDGVAMDHLFLLMIVAVTSSKTLGA